ncbi:hypothetical protein ACEYW6_18285 [Nostoc sp. UIC 10607]
MPRIAAIALANQIIWVVRNQKYFSKVANFCFQKWRIYGSS